MKKMIIVILVIIIGIITGIIFYNVNNMNNQKENTNIVNRNKGQNMITENIVTNSAENSENESVKQNVESQGDEEIVENARIKLTVNGNKEIFVNLDNNQASRDLLEMLPLTLTFEDFNSTEKIATLPNELRTEGQPSGYTPEIGDLAYYAPWGNISVFYKDFRYSNYLYKLGTIENGAEIFENMNNDFEVTIERVN